MTKFAAELWEYINVFQLNSLISVSKNITHDGVVIKTDGTQVTVRFVQSSACSGCHAKGICSSQDSAEKVVVAESRGEVYQVGDSVNIIVSNSTAWQAVRYAFALPLVMAMVCLFCVVPLAGEVMACLITLGLLALYYLVLYFLRHKLGSNVSFEVSRRYA